MLFKKSLKCPILKNLMIISFPTLQPNQLRHSIKGIAYQKTIPTMIPKTTRKIMHLKLNRVCLVVVVLMKNILSLPQQKLLTKLRSI